MKFGPVPVAQAQGAILAHSVKLENTRLRKGLVLSADDCAVLTAAGVLEVSVARLEDGDTHEDAAALELAQALVDGGAHVSLGKASTGRVNVFAAQNGLAKLDAQRINAANQVDATITVATVPKWQRLGQGGLVATIKIIAYGVPTERLHAACDAARGAISMQVPMRKTACLIETHATGAKLLKGRAQIEARLNALGVTLAAPCVVAHDIAELSAAIRACRDEVILILTASATSDLHDTAPEAVRRAGGHVEHFGMPVDPGNLLFLGEVAGKPVIGLPGCARSPALNGADWVLERVLCDVEIGRNEIMGLGVGGLLKEIPSRPSPREK